MTRPKTAIRSQTTTRAVRRLGCVTLAGSALLAMTATGAIAAPTAAGTPDGRTIYGITANGDRLESFPADDPSSPVVIGVVSGLGAGERVIGIDVSPTSDILYALTSTGVPDSATGTGHIYSVDKTTADATPVSTGAISLSGKFFDIDIDPCTNGVQIVSNTGENTSVSLDTGAVTTGTSLAYASGDANAGKTPAIVGDAFAPASGTGAACTSTLYDGDYITDSLAIQASPADGTLHTVGSFGVDTSDLFGMDIDPNGIAYLSTQVYDSSDQSVASATTIYTVDLATGQLANVQTVGGDILDAIAVEQSSPTAEVPELPAAGLVPIVGLAAVGALAIVRRRRRQVTAR
jgi:hypothetical protein